ncbi:hypothetical protein NDU88_006158 [Pleurodeles waltl]|uniref:Uncharacterized protein n=1 Tax=Pleurodeles waltl TaxID=8319 RepID=A0AAV7L538_PLEWA|nr:hypothetical protein NDU88_006158 [Pleurodeles waltl]
MEALMAAVVKVLIDDSFVDETVVTVTVVVNTNADGVVIVKSFLRGGFALNVSNTNEYNELFEIKNPIIPYQGLEEPLLVRHYGSAM